MPDLVDALDGSPAQLTDEVVLLRNGQAFTITVAELLATFQAALTVSAGALLGRLGVTAGAPETVGLGSGLGIGSGDLLATAADHLGLQLLTTMDVNAELVVNAGGVPARLPFALLRAFLSSGGVATSSLTWSTIGAPLSSLGAVGDIAMDAASDNANVIVWLRQDTGWTVIGQMPKAGSFDFSNPANSGLIPTL